MVTWNTSPHHHDDTNEIQHVTPCESRRICTLFLEQTVTSGQTIIPTKTKGSLPTKKFLRVKFLRKQRDFFLRKQSDRDSYEKKAVTVTKFLRAKSYEKKSIFLRKKYYSGRTPQWKLVRMCHLLILSRHQK